MINYKKKDYVSDFVFYFWFTINLKFVNLYKELVRLTAELWFISYNFINVEYFFKCISHDVKSPLPLPIREFLPFLESILLKLKYNQIRGFKVKNPIFLSFFNFFLILIKCWRFIVHSLVDWIKQILVVLVRFLNLLKISFLVNLRFLKFWLFFDCILSFCNKYKW